MNNSRIDELFLEHQRSIYVRTDRLFAWLMGLQWLGAIGTALLVSPRAWSGAQSEIHQHVWAAIVLGGAIVSLPIGLAVMSPGRTLTRHVVAVAQMLMSALLIHLTGGRIETHFHVFGSLAFLAFYRDWPVLLSGSIIVGIDHYLRGVFWPESVYGVAVAGQLRWLEHVWWVLFEDLFLVMAIRQSIEEMRVIAERQARAEQARSDAETANRIKDEFLATLSHELRTPLCNAFGWLSIMRRTPEDDRETFRHGLEVIDRNTRALAKLIDDLLDVSRIITGKMVLDVRGMSLGTIVESALESIRPASKAKEITLKPDLPPDDVYVRGDATRLQQVVWNLLSNAVKFTPKGGQVSVSITENGGNAVLKVADTGRGIPAEFLPHMFKRFWQADGSITRRFGGLGLGLAIVRHIVELHGGTVSAISDGTGKGAEFTVILPIESDVVVVREQRRSSGIRAGLLDGLTVLMVEDDVDTRDLIATILQGSGARVLSARSAAEALRFMEHCQPDVLLSDIGMPDEDGYSLIRKVRARESGMGRRLPAAALTAFAKTEDREAALFAGFDDHVCKPIEPDCLPIKVAELATRHGSKTESCNLYKQ